jgi:hypothetical protein
MDRRRGSATGPPGRAQGLARVEPLVDGRIPFPGARHQAPSPTLHPSNTVAASTNADRHQHSAGARRGGAGSWPAGREAAGEALDRSRSDLSTKTHLAVCIKNPAARLWQIGDVGMYKPTLRTGEPGTTEVVAFVSEACRAGRDPH